MHPPEYHPATCPLRFPRVETNYALITRSFLHAHPNRTKIFTTQNLHTQGGLEPMPRVEATTRRQVGRSTQEDSRETF